MKRREFIKKGALFGSLFLIPSKMSAARQRERRLRLYNIHTGEMIDTIYWMDGEYLGREIRYLEWVFRDHRTNEAHRIDPHLFDYLYKIDLLLGEGNVFNILSGYRSPRTNAMLRRTSRGVAKKSYHMVGKAVDIRLEDAPLAYLLRAAKSLHLGGVGYYPRSNFIHIDTGAPRFWRYPR
jgi:uncharacterized protein YcbK (DUF882 family)